MHCAYIKIDNCWCRITDQARLLEHDGQFTVCETQEDEAVIQETLQGMEPDGYVSKSSEWNDYGYMWIVAGAPIYKSPCSTGAEETLQEHRRIVVTSLPWKTCHTKGERYFVSFDPDKYVGVIGRQIHSGGRIQLQYELVYDNELWQRGNKRVIASNKAKEAKKRVTCGEIRDLGNILMRNSNFLFGNLNLKQEEGVKNIMAGFIVADHELGLDAVNEIVLATAQKWLRDLEDNENRFQKWLRVDHIKRLTERLKLAMAWGLQKEAETAMTQG